jgi:hypothetical protein
MKFRQSDNKTSDFFIRITRSGELFDVNNAIAILAVIKPDNTSQAQFLEIKEGKVYADLNNNMKDQVGKYKAQALLIMEDERVSTDVIEYDVTEDNILNQLEATVSSTDEFTMLQEILSRLSNIEQQEEQRMINEAERILSEENRKIEEAKRVEAELIRQHEEADRAKYDATRESNENTRKQNESIRLANETNRIDEESKRVEEEANRVEAEQLRKDNYNFMTEDEERRRSEANAHREAEVLRVQAETNRVNEEAKRRTTEQARVSSENTRVGNENTRKANETTRQTNETHRVEAETQRQSRYNSFITDAEANASNFENYTNSAKIKEEERKSNELDRKSQEDRRVSNEVERISNENTRKANEAAREKNETSRQYVFENKVNEVDKKIIEINATKDNFVSSINTKVDTKISELDNAKSDMTTTVSNKVNEVETRFNALTSSQQQDAEVIDARDGETSLKARLDRDVKNAKQIYANIEGSHISTDSSVGYAKDVEILGNTIQSASSLADIKSVGDKVEGQELYEIPVLSVGKNLFNGKLEQGTYTYDGSSKSPISGEIRNVNPIYVKGGSTICFTSNTSVGILVWEYNSLGVCELKSPSEVNMNVGFKLRENTKYINFRLGTSDENVVLQLEEGTQPTPYEPYQEEKLTILSPVQLEKVGDVCDRIIEKNGVWGVEKNIETYYPSLNKIYNYHSMENSFRVSSNSTDAIVTPKTSRSICNLLIEGTGSDWTSDKQCCYVLTNNTLVIKGDIRNASNLEEAREWIKSSGLYIKYPTTQPQFIPLPHSQQVKLRTFANKTNISFCCEIEGTIKAQVPKSLGATVNTHTEQIRSLNNELNRVKKLEESTVSTVTTESDFTTVEATNNGYFEDVKLEGKTLVNLAAQPTNNGSINHQYATISTVTNIKPSTVYTYIIRNNGSEMVKLYLNTNGGFDWFDLDVEVNSTVIGKARTLPTIDGDIWLSLKKAETVEQNLQVVLLEGDHTQNPPSYFEGLKSVGDGVDEIVVSSVKGDGNLLMPLHTGVTPGSYNKNNITFSSDYSMSYVANAWGQGVSVDVIGVVKGETYVVLCDAIRAGCIRGSKALTTSSDVSLASTRVEIVATSTGIGTITFKNTIETGDISFTNLRVVKKGSKEEFSVLNQDKKRLLYYNEETQTWEKPILRQWDSIEKHTNGKYYYHKRSAEVVLNGSENWRIDVGVSFQIDTICFTYNDKTLLDTGVLKCTSIVDKFKADGFNVTLNIKDCESYSTGWQQHYIKIQRSKLSTQDVEGFKQWLQANNVTVVYQLAQEKVYECTNIDLITYNGETNYIVESGVLSPKTTLKVHNNISNVVSLLQKKVSLLESNITSYMITQNRLMLASRYNADNVTFKVDYPSMMSEREVEIDYDLFKLIQDNIIVGPENYDVDKMLEIMDLYAMIGFITWEMWDYLYEVIDSQINPVIGDLEGAPEI